MGSDRSFVYDDETYFRVMCQYYREHWQQDKMKSAYDKLGA
jgi:hypothetical protein